MVYKPNDRASNKLSEKKDAWIHAPGKYTPERVGTASQRHPWSLSVSVAYLGWELRKWTTPGP